MKRITKLWPWFAASCSGFLYAACFAPFNLTWFCWIALTPLVAAIWFSGRQSRHRWFRNLLLGYVAGLTFFWIVFSWLTTVTVLGWFVLEFYMRRIVEHGYYPRSQSADEQTIEVVRRFDLSESIAPFNRCLRCNARLEEAAKADISDKLEPLTKIYYDQFRRCPECKQIYWPGSHFPKLQKRIEEIRFRIGVKA